MSTSLRILALISLAAQNVAWPQDPVPRLHVKHREVIGQRFLGNESHVEHFKLLERATTSILIGARNAIYNISLHDLTEIVDQRHAPYFLDGMTIDRTARDRRTCPRAKLYTSG